MMGRNDSGQPWQLEQEVPECSRMLTVMKQRGKNWRQAKVFTLRACPGGVIHPPARLHIPNFPKQRHQLGITCFKHPNFVTNHYSFIKTQYNTEGQGKGSLPHWRDEPWKQASYLARKAVWQVCAWLLILLPVPRFPGTCLLALLTTRLVGELLIKLLLSLESKRRRRSSDSLSKRVRIVRTRSFVITEVKPLWMRASCLDQLPLWQGLLRQKL